MNGNKISPTKSTKSEKLHQLRSLSLRQFLRQLQRCHRHVPRGGWQHLQRPEEKSGMVMYCHGLHRKIIGKSWENHGILMGSLWDLYDIYPLVNIDITVENGRFEWGNQASTGQKIRFKASGKEFIVEDQSTMVEWGSQTGYHGILLGFCWGRHGILWDFWGFCLWSAATKGQNHGTTGGLKSSFWRLFVSEAPKKIFRYRLI